MSKEELETFEKLNEAQSEQGDMEALEPKSETEPEVSHVFQGTDVEKNCGLLSTMTGSFVEPLLEIAQTKKVVVDQFGKLPDSFNVETEVVKLEAEFKRLTAQNPESKRTLLWAFLYLYKWFYIRGICLNVFNMVMNMIMPILVHRFVVFIEQEDYTQSDLNNAVMMMVFKEFLETAKYFQEKWTQ